MGPVLVVEGQWIKIMNSASRFLPEKLIWYLSVLQPSMRDCFVAKVVLSSRIPYWIDDRKTPNSNENILYYRAFGADNTSVRILPILLGNVLTYWVKCRTFRVVAALILERRMWSPYVAAHLWIFLTNGLDKRWRKYLYTHNFPSLWILYIYGAPNPLQYYHAIWPFQNHFVKLSNCFFCQ